MECRLNHDIEIEIPSTSPQNEVKSLVQNYESCNRESEKSKFDDTCATPKVGMVFKSYEETLNFYRIYALNTGFSVSVKKSSFANSGLCRRLILVCNKWGTGRPNECYQVRPNAKTNCPASITVRLWGDGLLHLVEANLEHNHALNPGTARSLRCYKKIPSGMSKDRVVRASRFENYKNSPGSTGIHESGVVRFDQAERETINRFLVEMQAKQVNFLYLIDFYGEGYFQNVFWADARSRAVYKYFNDVIWIDTSCLRDNFEIPLVSFIGVNHHGELVLLGCGLISYESVESYVWLFKSWLFCMEVPPIAIITDESKIVIDAIKEVFPNSRHGICITRVVNSISENLSGIIEEFDSLVYDSLNEGEFEQGWRNLVSKFGLENDKWVSFLYRNRNLWAPPYIKDTFWAGLANTRNTERLSTFFEGYLGNNTSLTSFLTNYESFLNGKYKREAQSDFESLNGNRVLVSDLYMEEQISQLYTEVIFVKFQDELKATSQCEVLLLNIENSSSTFLVKDYNSSEGRGKTVINKDHKVNLYLDGTKADCNCDCNLFSFKGIICRHALSVLKLQKIREIPRNYILNRWRKDYKKLHLVENPLKDTIITNNQTDRYKHLMMRCVRLAEIGANSEEKGQLLLKLVNEIRETLLDDKICHEINKKLTLEKSNGESNTDDRFNCSLPLKKRGRPPKKCGERSAETHLGRSVSTEREIFCSSSSISHIDTHERTIGELDLMGGITNPNDLSFGTNFGLSTNNHQLHLGLNQCAPQFEQTAMEGSSRMQWIYQQILQDDQIPFVQRMR